MSKSSAAVASQDVLDLSLAYNKPVVYVISCLDKHNIKDLPLPKFRFPDDGLGDFISDMTAEFFDPDYSVIGSDGKEYYPSRSMTKQEFTEEVDINNIMNRFIKSGGDITTLPLTTRTPMYGDMSSAPDSYHDAMNFVKETRDAFMLLPAELRSKLGNDPQQFLHYVADPANEAELIKYGFALPKTDPDASYKAEAKSIGRIAKILQKSSIKPSKGDSDDGDE